MTVPLGVSGPTVKLFTAKGICALTKDEVREHWIASATLEYPPMTNNKKIQKNFFIHFILIYLLL
ncbi:hypothetical protein TUM17377_39010 [Shewanella chilikensis]|nr:hypothetical protein TUM17377_39010 [Shewanella chilikensis]